MAKTKKSKPIQLNNFKSIDFVLLITIIILLALGIITVLSASAPKALENSGNSLHYFKYQFGYAIIGLGLLLCTAIIDYHFFQKHYFKIYIMSIILLILVVIFGKVTNGAKRWLKQRNLSLSN